MSFIPTGLAASLSDPDTRKRLADAMTKRPPDTYQGQGYRALGPALATAAAAPRPQIQSVDLAPPSQPQQPDMHPAFQAAAAAGQMPVPGMSDVDPGQPALPAQYQSQLNALFQPGPLQQRYAQMAQEGPGPAPHGFLGHLKGIGLGFLQGGLGGALVGGIAPGIAQRAAFRNYQLPEMAREADQEMQQQGVARQGYHALAQSTGRDPITGQPTLQAQQMQAMMGFRNAGLQNQINRTQGYLGHLADIKDQKQRANAIQGANLWIKNVAPYGQISDADRVRFKAQTGIDLPDDFDASRHELYDDANGVHVWNKTTGEMGPPLAGVQSAKGAAIKGAMERTQVAQAGANARQRLALEGAGGMSPADRRKALSTAQSAINRHSAAKTEAQKFDDLASSYAQQAENATTEKDRQHFDGLAREARIRANSRFDEMKRIADEAAADYPDLIEAGDDPNGTQYNYIKLKPGVAAGGGGRPAPGQGGSTAKSHDAALSQYQAYIKAHPEQREAARKKFMAQRGVDPEAQ